MLSIWPNLQLPPGFKMGRPNLRLPGHNQNLAKNVILFHHLYTKISSECACPCMGLCWCSNVGWCGYSARADF